MSSVKNYLNYLRNHLKKLTASANIENAQLLVVSSINTNSKDLILAAYLLSVVLTFEYKETTKCIELCTAMKAAARWFRSPRFEILGYEFLGKCLSSLFKHTDAVDKFSKMLRIALGMKDNKFEFKAYDNLSKEFFYLNSPSTAMFFHKRMIDGEFEPEDSILRNLILPEVNLRMGFKVYVSSLASYKSVERLNLDDLKVQAVTRKQKKEKTNGSDMNTSTSSLKSKTVYGKFATNKYARMTLDGALRTRITGTAKLKCSIR